MALRRSDGWIAAVSRMTRGPALASDASASTPPMRGIATSRSRTSGCESRAIRIASMPSLPSETTSKPGSLSSSRRNPSRKIGWSSAIEMRTRRGESGMDPSVQRELESRADAGRRIDRELCACDAGAFLDDGGPYATFLHFTRREAALELEPLPVVFDHEAAGLITVRQTHEHVACAAVLPHVDQRLLDDARQFERGRRRQ